jgi:hypothetical protein
MRVPVSFQRRESATRMDAKLLDACVLLLGPQVRRKGASILPQLDVAAVRRAYRVLAVATHPDAAPRGGARHSDSRRFIEASRAYELLMGYLMGRAGSSVSGPSPRADASRGQGPRHPGAERRGTGEKKRAGERRGGEKRDSEEKRDSAGKKTTGEKRSRSPLFYRGSVPRRRLRLAEFLYYSGRVSWQSLINAIVWQRAMQPKFGELAREMQGISGPDLAKILGSRLRHEQMGETAQRLRILTAAEVERVLRMQRARRRLIGRYFVEKESMAGDALREIIGELHRHNARYGRQG